MACEICQDVVFYIEQLVLEGYLERDIEELVAELCQNFPAPISTICQSYLDEYVHSIIQWIEEGIDSFDICTRIGLCTDGGPRVKKALARRPVAVKKVGDVMCDICNIVVPELISYILDDELEVDIHAKIEELCSAFEWPFDTLCATLVEQYVDQLIQAVEQGLDGIDFCQLIGICVGKGKTTSKVSRPVIRAKA
jgi:saposin